MKAYFKFWPEHALHHLRVPATNLFYNAEVSARRYPDKPYLVYYDTPVTFAAFVDEAQRVAGYLQQKCGVRKGDRVLLLMQNSPQFVLGYYGILRADAVVVPLNPMNLTQEILAYAKDAGGQHDTGVAGAVPARRAIARARGLEVRHRGGLLGLSQGTDHFDGAGIHRGAARGLPRARLDAVEGRARGEPYAWRAHRGT